MPPCSPISSPITSTVRSRAISSRRASFKAWAYAKVCSATAVAGAVSVDIPVHLLGWGFRSFAGQLDGLFDFGIDLLLQPLDGRGLHAAFLELLARQDQRIAPPPGVEFVLGLVILRIPAHVPRQAIGERLDERGSFTGAGPSGGLGGGLVDGLDVVAVRHHAAHTVGGSAVGEVLDA